MSNEIPAVFGLYVWNIFSTSVPLCFLRSQIPPSLPFRTTATQASRQNASEDKIALFINNMTKVSAQKLNGLFYKGLHRSLSVQALIVRM